MLPFHKIALHKKFKRVFKRVIESRFLRLREVGEKEIEEESCNSILNSKHSRTLIKHTESAYNAILTAELCVSVKQNSRIAHQKKVFWLIYFLIANLIRRSCILPVSLSCIILAIDEHV